LWRRHLHDGPIEGDPGKDSSDDEEDEEEADEAGLRQLANVPEKNI
jgi:hypothetical protein